MVLVFVCLVLLHFAGSGDLLPMFRLSKRHSEGQLFVLKRHWPILWQVLLSPSVVNRS